MEVAFSMLVKYIVYCICTHTLYLSGYNSSSFNPLVEKNRELKNNKTES